MTDTRSSSQRSRIMQAVRSSDTTPERLVRKLLFRLRYRFRLHAKQLPGTPDIVFPARRKVIFVHGCFWHAHGCRYGRMPKSRLDFWTPKLAGNAQRDRRNLQALRRAGWRTLIVWQCELRDISRVQAKLKRFLGPAAKRVTVWVHGEMTIEPRFRMAIADTESQARPAASRPPVGCWFRCYENE
jgi:DNA mismatch endonuclease, patch repair protein